MSEYVDGSLLGFVSLSFSLVRILKCEEIIM